MSPRCSLTLEITRKDGTRIAVPVTCWLDTDEEIAYFRAGGLLPMMCEQLLRAASRNSDDDVFIQGEDVEAR